MAKKRTQNKFENAAIGCIRTSFTKFSPKYGEVVDRCRVEIPKYKKDGTLAKRPSVFARCEICKELVKAITVDHIIPVIEIGKTRQDYTLSEIADRIDCHISNLQGICEKCHTKKTAGERILREEAKSSE